MGSCVLEKESGSVRNNKFFPGLSKQDPSILHNFGEHRLSCKRYTRQFFMQTWITFCRLHLAKNPSTASAVSSKTLSIVPFISFATFLILGPCFPARDSKRRAFFVATLLMTLTKPASFRKESPYNFFMCGLQEASW